MEKLTPATFLKHFVGQICCAAAFISILYATGMMFMGAAFTSNSNTEMIRSCLLIVTLIIGPMIIGRKIGRALKRRQPARIYLPIFICFIAPVCVWAVLFLTANTFFRDLPDRGIFQASA